MKDFASKAMKTILDYIIAVAIYFIFFLPFITIFGDNANDWLWLLSLILFLFLARMLFKDYKSMGRKIRNKEKGLRISAFKGFALGLAGITPIVLAGLTYFIVKIETPVVKELVDYGYRKFLFGPVYFIAYLFGEGIAAYAAAILIIPVTTMIGYLFGYYNFSLKNLKKYKMDEK